MPQRLHRAPPRGGALSLIGVNGVVPRGGWERQRKRADSIYKGLLRLFHPRLTQLSGSLSLESSLRSTLSPQAVSPSHVGLALNTGGDSSTPSGLSLVSNLEFQPQGCAASTFPQQLSWPENKNEGLVLPGQAAKGAGLE